MRLRLPVGNAGRILCLGILCAVSVLVPHEATADDNVPTPELHRLGLQIYADFCSVCHGPSGEGNGALASEFTPRPRDFTFGSFKFRSTGLGESPARADWISVIRNGIEGSYGRLMPAFDSFTDTEVLALVEVVRQFAVLDAYGTPVEIPPRRLDFSEVRARQLYRSAGCVECHGANYDGKGPAAAGLTDESGFPIAPADFTVGKFKGSADLSQIWLRIFGGIPGTPMPSFGQNVSPENLWLVAMYVASLGLNK